MRWLFLFLMLANAILLFWYAQQSVVPDRGRESAAEGLPLALVSEQPPAALRSVVGEGAAVDGERPELPCFMIGVIDNTLTAERIVEFFSVRGYRARINQQSDERVVGYQVGLPAPDGDAARVALLRQLDAAGVVPESRMVQGRLQFVLARYASERQAADFVAGLAAKLAPDLQPAISPVQQLDWTYLVQIDGPFDQEMSSKINAIVRKAYPELKIEKKLCKGVALPRGDH
ncbi:hypothetical protein [Marinobacterium arenosum]|uniref:hypothetical protein n=1 Tax=Marinobacterium arenosum TaxID=2862496 RepID=UPI001C9375CC|nr:hypothetical protein [Marinobacterium arenosum]MBY4676883.1 hypothetical protein [Marinobacterium arenosum]